MKSHWIKWWHNMGTNKSRGYVITMNYLPWNHLLQHHVCSDWSYSSRTGHANPYAVDIWSSEDAVALHLIQNFGTFPWWLTETIFFTIETQCLTVHCAIFQICQMRHFVSEQNLLELGHFLEWYKIRGYFYFELFEWTFLISGCSWFGRKRVLFMLSHSPA